VALAPQFSAATVFFYRGATKAALVDSALTDAARAQRIRVAASGTSSHSALRRKQTARRLPFVNARRSFFDNSFRQSGR
jgi:hypothetical protein